MIESVTEPAAELPPRSGAWCYVANSLLSTLLPAVVAPEKMPAAIWVPFAPRADVLPRDTQSGKQGKQKVQDAQPATGTTGTAVLCRRLTYPFWCEIWDAAVRAGDKLSAELAIPMATGFIDAMVAKQVETLTALADRLDVLCDYAHAERWPQPPRLDHPDAIARGLHLQPNHRDARPILPLDQCEALRAAAEREFARSAKSSGRVWNVSRGCWVDAE